LEVGEEVSEVGLFGAAELPDLAFPHDRMILSAWVRYEDGLVNGFPAAR
jgi:hypothetical protein